MANFNISDLITRLRNASLAHVKSIRVLNTKITFNILSLLYINGFIRGFSLKKQTNFIEVYLKYYQNRPVFYRIDLISRPGKRVY